MAENLTRSQKEAALRSAGMNDEQIEAILGTSQVAETDVRANHGEEADKYGISSIYKVYANGTARSRLGLRSVEAHVALIEQLQARVAELTGKE